MKVSGDRAWAKSLLQDMLDAAIKSAKPENCLPQYLPRDRDGKLCVIGFGKGSAAMAQVVEQHWAGPLDGLVVTRYGYAVPCRHIEVMEAAHPVPDENSLLAARRILEKVSALSEEDTVLCLVSGGGSSLMTLPGPGISLEQKQAINQALLRSGAPIHEMNIVRRHLSAIKGGHLAAATKAKCVTLIISDVPGDALADISSGPTVADPTTCADALRVIDRYSIDIPTDVRTLLEQGALETIKPESAALASSSATLVAAPSQALEAASLVARSHGITPVILGDRIEGEARVVGSVMAAIAHSASQNGMPAPSPCVIISGGETSVTVRGTGNGGRNVEFLLSALIALEERQGVFAIAADTDGVDGAAEIAGAFITPETLARARKLGLDPNDYLDRNDAHTFFEKLGDQIITGPTMTNVNDFRAILVLPETS